ncbi:MAG: hypothetical protein LBF39_02405 [Prevotellaceae bacterium]|jgi:hypothetical protein|nr:hypothetical protein [Prevotellaceae bacterium]
MQLKKYTFEECQEFTGATAILGQVVAICSALYEKVETQEEKEAIVEFQGVYAYWRNRITINEKESIRKVYDEVKPLITGTYPKLNIEYILSHTRRHAIAV